MKTRYRSLPTSVTGMTADSGLLSTTGSFDMQTVKNKIVRFFKNHDVNMCVTAILGIISTYVAIASVMHKNIFSPLSDSGDLYIRQNDPTTTMMAVVILWIFACATGKVLNLFNLPFPFGAMLVGVVIGNFDAFKKLEISGEWDFMVRRIALEVLIIRWGLAFNFRFIWKNIKTVLLLGTIPALAEAGAITLITAVVFGHYWGISVMLGAVTAAASVPVVIPVMFKLTHLGLGTERSIPKIIPSALAVDTFICLFIFTIAGTAFFAKESSIDNVLQLLIDVGLCVVGALALALVLWHFPKSKEGHTVFARGYILLFSAVAAINGMFYFGHGYAGIIFTLILASLSSHKWRNDNPRTVVSIEKTFLYIWNLVSSPLLFVLCGMKLKFSAITITMALSVFALVLVGILFRLAAGYLVSYEFKQNERYVIIMSMLPKATLQGALAPAVLTTAANFPHLQEEAEFLVNAVLLSILFTAPIGRYLLEKMAPKLLAESEGKPMPEPSIHSNDSSSAEEDISIDATFKQQVQKQRARCQSLPEVKVIGMDNTFDKLPRFTVHQRQSVCI